MGGRYPCTGSGHSQWSTYNKINANMVVTHNTTLQKYNAEVQIKYNAENKARIFKAQRATHFTH